MASFNPKKLTDFNESSIQLRGSGLMKLDIILFHSFEVDNLLFIKSFLRAKISNTE